MKLPGSSIVSFLPLKKGRALSLALSGPAWPVTCFFDLFTSIRCSSLRVLSYEDASRSTTLYYFTTLHPLTLRYAPVFSCCVRFWSYTPRCLQV